MQNEPNFTHNFSHILTRRMRLLKLFTRKMSTFRYVLQLLDNNTLNSIYNKDLQSVLPQNTLLHSRNQRYEKMQNEPNSNTPNKLKRHPAMPDSTNNQSSILTVPCAPGIDNQWKGEPNYTKEFIRQERTLLLIYPFTHPLNNAKIFKKFH